MTSQLDLDQGGTARQWVKTYLGPTIGWVFLPGRNPLEITSAGTFVISPDTSLVRVNVNGAVILTLPTAIDPASPAVAQPALAARTPITIVDIGGFAGANPITIQPASGAENIMGLASIQINSPFGAFTLSPSNVLHGWTNSNQ
jgi:hypothetical protein